MEIYKITKPDEWTYFAKGSANILFKYTGDNDYLRHKLLRLRLVKSDEEYISTCELYDFIELKCKHLFYSPQQVIIDIQLVVLTREFVANLNSHGHKLQLRERYGLLLPNILDGQYARFNLSKNCQLYINSGHHPQNHQETAANGTTSINTPQRNGNSHVPLADSPTANLPPDVKIDSVIFEIKPKWLYDNTCQNYCRTCSYNQLRQYKRHFCPLDLLFPETIDQGLDDIFSAIPPATLNLIESRNKFPLKQLFRAYLQNPNNVFLKLKQFQKINNRNDLIENLTSSKDVSQNLSLVMTLRDVGLFIKFEKYDRWNDVHNSHNNVNNLISLNAESKADEEEANDDDESNKYLITCNIYDLDLKSKMKYKHWLKVEHDLQEIYYSDNGQWRHCTRVKHSN
ncbi:uncharacterized protein LODBEIA_P51920 [Lodderomyces beijingensis]|uniref:Inositol-pentakisphosphate 2-kinase n=1 Tax=Lodderomyces beijingensis TaxID=1775926 RepID=A0ABP0ZTH4_9ASCO